MKAVVSTTYDDKYLFFLPITTWCWNKLGVDVICFMPYYSEKIHGESAMKKWDLITDCIALPGYTNNQFKNKDGEMCFRAYAFDAPEHKEATYAQCSRLYAAALDLPEDVILITSDIDMMATSRLLSLLISCFVGEQKLVSYGYDLVPGGQLPICYAMATVKDWRLAMNIKRTYQEELDGILKGIECENFRGNYWSKDQEVMFNQFSNSQVPLFKTGRARPGTQFAANRVDRDDINWRSYCGPDLIDAHLWRPGYTDENFLNIMELLQTQYPSDNFQWLIDYRNEYIKIL